MTRYPRRAAIAALTTLALATTLSGCVAPQHAGMVHDFHASAGMALDGDRSRSARVAAGVGAASLGVSLGCTMLHDTPGIGLKGLRNYCLARQQMIGLR